MFNPARPRPVDRRRRWRRRAALLLVLSLAALVPVFHAGEQAEAGPAESVVLDLDLTPNPSCSGPVRARIAVYHPEGAKTGAAVEWRMRLDGDTLRTGTVRMRASIAGATVTIPAAEVPSRGEVTVDTRLVDAGAGEPGPYGKPWRETLRRGCDPVRVVSIGDSVVWNQGLDQHQKFPRLTADLLGEATGRGYQHADYSISGAVLDAPDLPAGNVDAACLGERYVQDPDNDGEMELGEVTQQMPDVFCQLERAGADARAAGHGVDLVIMNGCINDMDPFLGIAAGFTPGTEDVPAAVKRECSGVGALPENPARDVKYFSGAKVGYGGRGMRAAIEKAHALPGHPKVLLVNFFYALSRASLPTLTDQCGKAGLPENQVPRCRSAVSRGAERYELFTRHSGEAYRQAAEEANAASADGAYAVAADGLFTLDNAVLAQNTKLWANPTVDPVYPLRRQACPEFSPYPAQCLTATVAHPDVAGSRQYADSLLLNPQLRNWFGLGPAETAPLEVLGTGADVTLRGPAADGARYRWYFGDGATTETTVPTASHTYTRSGPHLPRLVITAAGGRRTLHEAAAPVAVE